MKTLFQSLNEAIQDHDSLSVITNLCDELHSLCTAFCQLNSIQNEALVEQLKKYVELLSCTLETLPKNNKSLVPSIFL